MNLSARFEEALAYAARLHAVQERKGSRVPYITHLLGTAALALQYGAGEDEAIAALLHDAVEDQGGKARLEEIRERFGEPVAAIVASCTDSWSQPKPPWRQRKEAYLEHLPSASRAVLLVSCADKIDNARSILKDYRQIGDALWQRFRGAKEGTLWYYRSLVRVFGSVEVFPIGAELGRVVAEIEAVVSAPQGD
jgi:(p)ppGpp synthase/HD superfamily hydrolase